MEEKNYYSLGECKKKGNREEFGEVLMGTPSRKAEIVELCLDRAPPLPSDVVVCRCLLDPKAHQPDWPLRITRRLLKSVLMGPPIHSVNACFDKCGAVQLLHFRDWFLICDKNPGQLRGISLT